MDRRAFVAGSLSLLATPLAVEAQSAGKVYRIALVHPNARVAGMTEVKNPYFKVLFSELRRLGYVEGQNLVVERRSGYGRPARFPEFARGVVQLQPDLILLFSSRLAHAIQCSDHDDPARRDHGRSDSRQARDQRGPPGRQPHGFQHRHG